MNITMSAQYEVAVFFKGNELPDRFASVTNLVTTDTQICFTDAANVHHLYLLHSVVKFTARFIPCLK